MVEYKYRRETCYTGKTPFDVLRITDGKIARKIIRSSGNLSLYYPLKQVQIYLNDNSEQKIEKHKKYLSPNERNFHIITSSKNSDELLETIDPQLYSRPHLHFFLFYDLYDASIN